jgi:DNA-binding transcriptional ArsR family regulator
MLDRLAQLLGSSTRANIVEALALAKKPLTAYRISKMYNMNFSKVYIEMKKLKGLGLVSTIMRRRGVEYVLIDENLRALALELSSRTITYDDWSASEERARRFRGGLIKVPKFSLVGQNKSLLPLGSKPTRLRGELRTLALLARSKFDKKYRRIGDRQYVRV